MDSETLEVVLLRILRGALVLGGLNWMALIDEQMQYLACINRGCKPQTDSSCSAHGLGSVALGLAFRCRFQAG